MIGNKDLEKLDLIPLQYCKKLEKLHLLDTQLQRLDVTPLQYCENLTELFLSDDIELIFTFDGKSKFEENPIFPSALEDKRGKINYKIREFQDPPFSEEEIEEFIERHPEIIEEGLTIIDRQIKTPKSNIDLLGEDISGNIVVIELKKGKVGDAIVGQIGRYLTWAEEEFGPQGKTVRGIIVVKEMDEKIKAGLKALKFNIDIHEFRSRVPVADTAVFCDQCGSPMHYTARFCKNCGKNRFFF